MRKLAGVYRADQLKFSSKVREMRQTGGRFTKGLLSKRETVFWHVSDCEVTGRRLIITAL